MTENKAIEWLRAISATQNQSSHSASLSDRKEALYMAIQALEEIRQYRAIGTVEEIKANKIIADERYDYLMDNIGLLKQYASIGTIEECRTSVERMKPKKVVHIHKSDAPEDIEYMGEEVLYGKCPCCDGYNNNLWNAISCGDCGALLDWSE